MYRFPLWRPLLLLGMVVLIFGQSPVLAQSPPTATELLNRLKAKYESLDALSANFNEVLRPAYSDTEQELTGILIMSGDMYRLETETLTVVTDGTTNWVYLPEDHQVTISDYTEDETTFSPSQFFVTQPDQYNATYRETSTLAGVTHHVLHLVPKDEEAFIQEATLWIRDQDNLITKMELVDMNETHMLFNLNDIRLNPTTNGQTFQYQIPDGAEVIDLRF